MQASLDRFKEAQKEAYQHAYEELSNGKKKTHWMWYIFPQILGLGYSTLATYYAIEDMNEAISYLDDEELYARLITLCQVLLEPDKDNASKIFGRLDAQKLQSSMTLFSYAAELRETKKLQEESNGMPKLFTKSSNYRKTDKVFNEVLLKFFNGEKDHNTEEILFFNKERVEMQEFTPPVQKQL